MGSSLPFDVCYRRMMDAVPTPFRPLTNSSLGLYFRLPFTRLFSPANAKEASVMDPPYGHSLHSGAKTPFNLWIEIARAWCRQRRVSSRDLSAAIAHEDGIPPKMHVRLILRILSFPTQTRAFARDADGLLTENLTSNVKYCR